jgi:mannose-6-phosphate isomerase-like protein (cupin superfamily)
MMPSPQQKRFMRRYRFEKDTSRPGRSLQCVKVGDVYVTRLVIDPGKILGNLYYKQTNLIFFVEYGRLEMKCVQVHTKEEAEMLIGPGEGIIHLPPYVGIGLKNFGKKKAVLIMLSNKPLRSDDEYEYQIYTNEFSA